MVSTNSSIDPEAQAKLNTLVGALVVEVLARLGVSPVSYTHLRAHET